MNRIHIALAVRDFAESIAEYTRRLRIEPCCTVEGTYALWRTDTVNLSISVTTENACRLRHLGFEDPNAPKMSDDTDVNGIVWERFTAEQQREEILKYWPHAQFTDRGALANQASEASQAVQR